MTTDTDTHLAVIDKLEAGLQAMREANAELPDFDTAAGLNEAKRRKRDLVTARTTGDKARLAATSGLREQVKEINARWSDTILPEITALEEPLAAGIKKIADEEARVKREAEEREAARVQAHQDRIQAIRTAAGNAVTLEQVQAALAAWDGVSSESFEEFMDEAEQAMVEMYRALNQKRRTLTEQAEEAERVRVEREKLDAERAAFEAEQAKAREEQEAAERARQEAERAEQQKAREAELAAQAEREKAAAIEAAKAKAIEEERQRVEREAAEKAEAERVAAEQAAAAPYREKLAAWWDSVPPLPDGAPKAMQATHKTLAEHLDAMGALIAGVESRKAA